MIGVVLAIVAGTISGQSARAQMMMGMDGGFGTLITKRSLDVYARLLDLDKDQRESAQVLLEGYTTESQKVWKEFGDKQQAAMAEAQEEQDWKGMQKKMAEAGKVVRDRGTAIEKQFFDDLRSLCSDKQLNQWVRVERARRRETLMRIGMVSGAGVDLIAVVERTQTAPKGSPEFDALVQQYELEADRKLQDMKAVQDEQQAKQEEAMKDGFDMAKMQEMMAKVQDMLKTMADSAKGVRDLNRDYTRKLAALMGESERAKFQEEVQRRSFPRVYRASHTGKMLEAAAGFSDLTPDQREQVTSIRESYHRDAAALNERWSKAIEDQEEKNGGTFGVMTQMWMGGGEGADEVKEARKARKQLDDQTGERLKAVLTDAQRARLPEKAPERFNPMADFMPDDGDAELSVETVGGRK
jgi:hypothetical protein